MSVSFILEAEEVRVEGQTIRLFMRDLSGSRVEIRRNILLCDDYLDESDEFKLQNRGDTERCLLQHMIGKLLLPPDDHESLAAWYATIAFASAILQMSLSPRQIVAEALAEENVVLTGSAILEVFGTDNKYRRFGSDFLLLSETVIESFLLGELDRNPSAINAVRERITQKTIGYLEQLRFSSNVIEDLRGQIGLLDNEYLEEVRLDTERDRNGFMRIWFKYFRNLDASYLSRYRPSEPFSAKKAYIRIRAWYQSNKAELSRLAKRRDNYISRSVTLIDALPPVSSVTFLEIRAVFREVLSGLLEWAYHDSDGEYKMSEYAKLAFKAKGLTQHLSEDELTQLATSWIWPFIKR